MKTKNSYIGKEQEQLNISRKRKENNIIILIKELSILTNELEQIKEAEEYVKNNKFNKLKLNNTLK